ncbi:MAG: hypothetical protein IT304_01970 [Dehalococcoidia bacterium]|nr:hypothetical protein [Dehalococcoidia bacterium]
MGSQPLAQLATSLAVCCPRCQRASGTSTWVHPRRIEVDRLGDVVEVAPDGIGFLHRPISETENMGSVIRIEFWCESGHQFAWDLRFEGGATVFQIDPQMPEFDPLEYMDELPRA